MAGSSSSGSGSSYDGHLDLDDLDLATSLEVVGDDDAPRLSELLAARLEQAGITPWMRRHRTLVASVTTVVVLAVACGALWWASRPVPLPTTPRVLAKVSGADPTSEVVRDQDGTPVAVTQRLSLTTAERMGVEVAVALTGPGLRPPAAEDFVVMRRTAPDDTLVVSADLDCAAPEATTAVLGAVGEDYGILLRRTAPEGETRVDPAGVIGARDLVDVVHRSCLQLAADRDLTARSVSALAVPGLVAVDVDVEVSNTSTRGWTGLTVSPGAMPTLVNGAGRTDLEPGEDGRVRARLWPPDCAHPTAAIADGLPLQVDLASDGNGPSVPLRSPNFDLHLPADAEQTVGDALTAACGTAVPQLTVVGTHVRQGASGSVAGILDLDVSIEAPDADYVEAEAAGALVVGQLSALRTPVRVRDGGATMTLRWALPACPIVLRGGRPQVAVTLVGDLRRPYLLDLSSERLRPALSRLCGDEVADAVAR